MKSVDLQNTSKPNRTLRLGLSPDLLHLYIRNHRTSWWYYAFVFVSFVAAKIYLYGINLSFIEILSFLTLAGISAFGLYVLKEYYMQWVKDKEYIYQHSLNIILKIAFLRFLIIIPWLVFLFMPLSNDIFYRHLLGYSFIFCAISAYASISSAHYLLLIIDIGFLILFSMFLTVLNFDVPETRYAQAIIIIFAVSSIFTALKNNRAAKKFVSNENALRKAAKEAAKSSKAKADFLAVMSHEIRTPMTGIMGMVDFLKDSKLDKDQTQCLNTITQCSKTLLNTINDVLDISKMEAGQMAISPVDFDFKGLIKGIEKTFETMAAQKGVGFSVMFDPSTPQYVHADPNRIQQVILNLANNAIKFTNNGSVTIRVQYEGMIRVEVEDTGIGVSQEQENKLFQKFSQVDGSISRDYGGTGLGLYIAQNLIESMGGCIGFKSAQERGSIFWFEIPYISTSSDETNLTHSSDHDIEYTPMKILLVDDNALNRKIISKYLGKYHAVQVADSGRQALQLLEKDVFDIILMDLQMPDLDGYETTAKIKRMSGRVSKIPVLAMSANVLEKGLVKCKQAGMIDHIAKPIDPPKMFSTIEKYAEYASNDVVADQKKNSNEAPLKSDDIEYKNETLSSMVEQLGSDYVDEFLKDSYVAILQLEREIDETLKSGDCNSAAISAHNMVSLLGNIGLIRSAHVAQSIEKLCKDEGLQQARSTYSLMKDALSIELHHLKNAYKL